MKVDIAAISLDVQNFRHPKVTSEREAIRMLLSDEKNHKVSELAQDIIDLGGLDPSSLLIVTEDVAAPGRFIALEGNRRVTALKTMLNPDLAMGLPTHSHFRQLHKNFLDLNLSAVECVVLDRPAAAAWIKRKHYKGMGGRGVLQWNAIGTARSDAAEGRYTRWMTALAFLEENGIDAEDIRDSIARKTTTVERVLSSSHIPNLLGLTFSKSGVVEAENGDRVAAAELLEALLSAMADPGFKEPDVSTANQQRSFLERFILLSVKNPDNSETSDNAEDSARKGNPSPGGAAANGFASNAAQVAANSKTSTASKSNATSTSQARSKPVRDRTVLAERGLRISNANLNRFYGELRKLSVEGNPFISAAIIRIFLEKSTTVFLEEMDIPPLSKVPGATWHDYGIKLKLKVDAALKQIDPGEKNANLAPARDVANGNQDRLHSLDELNKAIHDHRALPAPSEIITMWDRFHPYFFALFEAIENNKK